MKKGQDSVHVLLHSSYSILAKMIANMVVMTASIGLDLMISDPLHRSVSQKQVVKDPTVLHPLVPKAMQFLSK